jgi:hypothetical protein
VGYPFKKVVLISRVNLGVWALAEVAIKNITPKSIFKNCMFKVKVSDLKNKDL